MILCDCCERRNGDSFDPCHCTACFCNECMFCSQHCYCLHYNPTHIPLDVLDDTVEMPWQMPDNGYSNADKPTVVPG